MTNRRRTDSTQTVSLFPFLAVLLCTMGALVVLLVVMARQARLRAVVEETGTSAPSAEEPASGRREPAVTAAAPTHDPAALTAELAELHRRAEQLSTMRSDAQQRLKGAQLRLGNSEDHLRTLQDRVRAAYEEAEKLATLDQTRLTNRRKAEEELARLKDLVIASETELDSARDEAAKRPKSYAIVPYKGSHGTRRRPIYIECRKDAVVLLPESIRFTPHDFDEPVGPGNPLAAALRAVREYQTAHLADPTAQEAQPYPLLLIRPDGVAAYYRAREAIASWGPDFGYEMIDADWSLELPAADPNLTRVVFHAVKSARARQRLLAQAAPRRFRRGSATGGLHGENVTGGGGEFYVPSESLAEGTGDRGQGTGDRGQGTGHRGQGTGDRGQGTGDGGHGIGDGGQEQGDGQGNLSGDALLGTQYPVLGTHSSGESGMGTGERPPSALGTQSSGESGMGTGEGPPSVLGTQPSGASGMGTGEGPPAPVGGAGTAGTGAAEIGRYAPPIGDAARRYGGSTDGNERRDPRDAAPPRAPGQARAGDTANSASNAHAASPDGQSSGGSTSGVVAGGPDSSGNVSPGPGGGAGGSAAAAAAVATFSATLGQPGGSGGRAGPAARAVPIRRAINVIVRNDRLAILPEQGVGGGRIVPVNGDVDTAAGDFAAALRDRVKRWGIAGQGLYWKPILVLKPAPDGIANANRLARRLRSSGVEVQMPGSVARRAKK